MIIHDLHVIGAVVLPNKTDPPLIGDPNTVLALAIAFQGLEPVPRQIGEIREGHSLIQAVELSLRLGPKSLKTPYPATFIKGLSVAAAKGPNHEYSLSVVHCPYNRQDQEILFLGIGARILSFPKTRIS